MKSEIELWSWEKKPRTMLRYVKVGDIVCYEVDETGQKFGYGQLIADMEWGYAFKALGIFHTNPDDIKSEEIINAQQIGRVFILDVYATFDKGYVKNGQWRIIGREKDFNLKQSDIDNIYFVSGVRGMLQKTNLLRESYDISDQEQDTKGYVWLSPTSGDEAKEWYLID